MASVTYKNLNGDAPSVAWQGFRFEDGKAIDVDDSKTALLDKAETNPFFEVSGRQAPAVKRGPGRPPKATTGPRADGVKALKDGLAREAPSGLAPAETELWLAGYDSGTV